MKCDGEKQAADRLSDAAKVLSSQEGGMFIRMLRTIPEISSQQGNVVAFPLPMEFKYLWEGIVPGKQDENEKKNKE